MPIRRLPERALHDRTELYAVLDAGWVATLAVAEGGRAQVVPVLYGRDGDSILVHGSTGAGTLRLAAAGRPVTLCVTHLDGFVYAASLFESSANYRSAVVEGVCERLDGDAAHDALHMLGERLMPGRSAEVRANRPKEYAATMVLRLPITDGAWTAKARAAGPSHEPDDDPQVWTGVLPIETRLGTPVPSELAAARGIPLAASIVARLFPDR